MKSKALVHVAAGLVALIFTLPLFWVVAGALRKPGLPPPRTVEWLPQPVAWENFSRLFEILPFGQYTLNSLLITLVALPLTLLTASWAGFALALASPRLGNALAGFTLVLLLIPSSAFWLTRFLVFKWFGWIDTYFAMLVPALMGTSPLFVLLFFWTFRRIPPDLLDSARLDGASNLGLWSRVMFPLAKPAAVAVGSLTFMTYWSDFISPILYLKSEELYTLPIGLQQLQQLDKTNWPILMAGCVVLTVPPVLAFLFVQRAFLQESRFAGHSSA